MILQNKLAVNPNYHINALNAGYSVDKKGSELGPEDRSFLESNTTKPSNLHDSIMHKALENGNKKIKSNIKKNK